MPDKPSSADWADYPLNLERTTSIFDGCDCVGYHEQLAEDSERLFIQDGRLCLRIIEVGIREIDIRSVSDLEQYLQSATCPTTRFFLIPQQSSWGRLVISHEALCRLFSHYSVHPAFLDVLRAFGQRTGPEHESCAELHLQHDQGADLEFSYLVKHAERHRRADSSNPWSVRQMGVYHRANAQAGDVFIIINPSQSLQQRLKMSHRSTLPHSSSMFHVMIHSSAMNQWRWYTAYMEQQYISMKTKAQLAHVLDSGDRVPEWTDIHFNDIQDIQVLQDHFIQTQYHLATNRMILREMETNPCFSARIENRSAKPERSEGSSVASLITEVDVQALRVKNVLQRVEATLALVRSILDFRCLASMQTSSKNMAELTILSRNDNQLMVELTEKASRDTDILKTVTLLGLVYLPAGFVASLMGMNYIAVEDAGHLSIRVKGEFWVFLVLTAILLIGTLGSYFFWMRKRPHWGRVLPGDDSEKYEASR